MSQCTSRLKSSHQWLFLPEPYRAPIAESLMGSLFVVPPDPTLQLLACLAETLEVVLPDTFFFQTAKESLDQPILLRRIGCDVFLLQPIKLASFSESTALKYQTIVTADDRRSL